MPTLLRDLGGLAHYPYLAELGLDPDDAGRLDVVAGAVAEGGLYVNAETGDSQLLQADDATPAGVWIAQRDLDDLKPGPGTREEPHGFGEGFGTQREQVGGDRSYPSEDSGGVRRVAHGEANREEVNVESTEG